MSKEHKSWSNRVWAKARTDAGKAGKPLDTERVEERLLVLKAMREPSRSGKPTRPELGRKRQEAYIRHVQRTYGLDLRAYVRLFQSQDYKCAVCAKELELFSVDNSPVVDHCHTTGKVRGLLCQGCNIRVGRLEVKLSKRLNEAASQYIKKHKA